MDFKIHSNYKPTGDQPQAIDKLAKGIDGGMKHQTLLGVTGSGKTFTMANLIERVQKPTLVIAHNKTLAYQLASEFREFFRTTPWNTSSATTITTSRKPTCRGRIPLSQKTPALTTKSTSCATPPPWPFSSGAT